jgi:predicted lactoylglutathione lyase
MPPSQPPLANLITLGVHDLVAERGFYRRLGWPVVLDSEDFVVFELRGAVLALFPRAELARDAHAQPAPPSAGIACSVIITVDRPEDVDELAAHAAAAGATLTKQPTDPEFFAGRHAYFADPEGNYWEIAWARDANPVTAAARRAAGQRAAEH